MLVYCLCGLQSASQNASSQNSPLHHYRNERIDLYKLDTSMGLVCISYRSIMMWLREVMTLLPSHTSLSRPDRNVQLNPLRKRSKGVFFCFKKKLSLIYPLLSMGLSIALHVNDVCRGFGDRFNFFFSKVIQGLYIFRDATDCLKMLSRLLFASKSLIYTWWGNIQWINPTSIFSKAGKSFTSFFSLTS